ncbi:HEAT repeat domain-containing protein [Desulfobulbus oligotrophicus]|nr:HEAT repeat domain-containing protein [Desulfobulbus oligotrophicus]
MRLYPSTNPQVQRSNDFFFKTFSALLTHQTTERSVTIACSDGRLLICGEHLTDKDHARPQIQGLITLFNRLQIHSLTFHEAFTTRECSFFVELLSSFLAEKEASRSIASLLSEADITSVTVDTMKYVVLREGEQVVNEELIGSGLDISDEELTNFILEHGAQEMIPGVSSTLVDQLIGQLSATGTISDEQSEDINKTVIDLLQQLSQEPGAAAHDQKIAGIANHLAGLDPSVLAQLVAHLPITADTDSVLSTIFNRIPPEHLHSLLSNLTLQHILSPQGDVRQHPMTADNALSWITHLEQTGPPDVSKAIAQNIDARQLLLNPDTPISQLPEHLLQRLRQPEWSAPVITAAARQVSDPQAHTEGQTDFAAFNRMLAHYEQLLSKEQQTRVARQAGAELASMEGIALGNILAQRFKGLFGEQLYSQVLNQVSDQLLDETIEHLTPKQLNRMVATLISDIPLQIGKDKDPGFKPVDDILFKRLAQTRRGPELSKAIAQNIDARQLLLNPDTPISQLPEHLLQRLRQPEWSAPVITAAARQVSDPQAHTEGQTDFAAFNRMLAHYEQLLSKEQQTRVARQAGAELASMEGIALGNILAQRFKGLFGEQLYSQVLNQVSDQLLDETIEHLTPKQLNRMVATLISDIPLQIGKDKDPGFKPVDDILFKRLAQTRRGPELSKAIAQNIDARQLLLNPDTPISQLPEHLLQRLRQPEWSAPVITAAARQVSDPQAHTEGQTDFAAFNRMLAHYEQLLSKEQQTRVARQAGAELASMEGIALGNILAQRFKGLFGEQLYSQVLNQVSDQLLDETIEHLTPKQLNRMVATLISDIPLQIGKDKDPGFKPVDDILFKRLAQTRRGPELSKAIAQNIDARQLLLNPDTPISQLPEHLLQRLRQPEWSAPVITAAARQVSDPQAHTEGQTDFAAFNRMLAHYEQLLSKEQQTRVARQAGAELASMEGIALGNILAQRFKGLFGEQLYSQVLNQVSDQLLDETIEHLTPKQLNRMVATLISDIPLQIGKDKDPGFKPVDDILFKRLAQTRRGPELSKAIAQNIDARQLLLNPDTPISQLPEHLLQRLRQPEWSAPVITAAARQVSDPQAHTEGQTDFAAFNRMLAHYEQLLSKEQQTRVARQAGAELASMEGIALGNILAQRFKGLFGEQLYSQVLNQVSDQLLDETIEHLTPKQLNRMVATLISDIPLQIGKDKDPGFKPVDDILFKRLAQTRRGPELSKAIAQNIDARQLLLNPDTPISQLPEHLLQRLRQPEWSAPVITAAARQVSDLAETTTSNDALATFEQLLTRCDSLFDPAQQVLIASQVASQLITLDEKSLGRLLVHKYKSLFGDQLYRQVISRLSEDKLEKLITHIKTLAESSGSEQGDLKDTEVEKTFQKLQQTARKEKMRSLVALYQAKKKATEEKRQTTVQTGLHSLLQGDLRALNKKALLEALPTIIHDLLNSNEEKKADDLLMQLAIGTQNPEPSISRNAFTALAAVSEQFVNMGQWERLKRLLPALQRGLQTGGISEQAAEQVTVAIGALTKQYLTEKRYTQAAETAQILRSLTAHTATDDPVDPSVRQHAAAALKKLSTVPTLEHLLELYLHSETHQEAAARLLGELGTESAEYQLQQLMDSDSRFERKRLLSLIKQTGNPALSILLEQLQKDPPWFVVRNIIRLLGDIGTPELFTTIQPFIHHSDVRVQEEVLNASVKIGNEDLKDFLLQTLQTADNTLKPKVVQLIATHHDERFVRPLTELLESTKSFAGKGEHDLQLAICRTLGNIGSRRAGASLTRVAESKTMLGIAGYSDEVRQAAVTALKQIRKATEQRSLEESAAIDRGPSKETTPPSSLPAAETVTEQEAAIFQLADEGKRESAIQQLVDLISATAQAGDFKTAERLRERIYEIDGMALGPIIRTGELIEQAKMGTIKEEDKEIWATLRKHLTAQEFQTIYHELNEQQYKPEDTIVSQGDKNDALFFITQGSVKVSHRVGTRELFITTLNRGEMVGENFFTPSVWTATLTSLTPSRVHVLPQAALAAWQEQFPGLRGKLHTYYLANNTIRTTLEKKGLERRTDHRYSLSRKIQVQPINNLEKPIGRGFRAETIDISLGGLAFLIRISRQENARLLLGRKMQIVLPVGGKIQFMHLKGLVIGIQPFQVLENDFSVHFKFDQPLASQALQNILG